VKGGVAGTVQETGRSVSVSSQSSRTHAWEEDDVLEFETRSSWGAPQTLSLQLLSVSLGENGQEHIVHSDENGQLHYTSDVGSCWIDLKSLWDRIDSQDHNMEQRGNVATVSCHAQVWSTEMTEAFDEHGEIPGGLQPVPERLELELRVTTELLQFGNSASGYQSRKRMLLYKHDDDLRQEMFAIQFVEICDSLLKASGLDLKLLTFRSIPVGAKRGFIEWVPGSIPLSDICRAFGSSVRSTRARSDESSKRSDENGEATSISEIAKAGLGKYQSLFDRNTGTAKGVSRENSLSNNPIQDFLRSVAYDPDQPYLIRREVMDNYVKSCAGYCVITYILGVGDRHLDNLLLHYSGRLFHCDYSFILGSDPKTYLPMRITEDMVHGMGGRGSDNYAKFLSLTGAAFIALRRHENLRVMMSLLRLMIPAALPDLSVNQPPEQVLCSLRDRLRLDLSDEKAVSFMEQLVEENTTSRMWMAVDAIHNLGKRL